MNVNEKQMQESLRELESQLDGATLSKLARVRSTALERNLRRPLLSDWRTYGGVALASVLTLVLVLPSQNSENMAEENADLYDNIEFYSWMVETEQNAEDLKKNLDFYQWLAESELSEQSRS